MPGYRIHLFAAVVVAASFIYLLRSYASSVEMISWIVFALAGALFPDVDTTSKGQKWFYSLILPTLLLLLLLKRFTSFIMLALMVFAPLVVNHRGLFHRLWFVVLPPLGIAISIAWHFPSYAKDAFFAASFFILGIISHLVLDLGIRRTFRLRR